MLPVCGRSLGIFLFRFYDAFYVASKLEKFLCFLLFNWSLFSMLMDGIKKEMSLESSRIRGQIVYIFGHFQWEKMIHYG
jgi:hypothetical protein